jgi:hypothetical protein
MNLLEPHILKDVFDCLGALHAECKVDIKWMPVCSDFFMRSSKGKYSLTMRPVIRRQGYTDVPGGVGIGQWHLPLLAPNDMDVGFVEGADQYNPDELTRSYYRTIRAPVSVVRCEDRMISCAESNETVSEAVDIFENAYNLFGAQLMGDTYLGQRYRPEREDAEEVFARGPIARADAFLEPIMGSTMGAFEIWPVSQFSISGGGRIDCSQVRSGPSIRVKTDERVEIIGDPAFRFNDLMRQDLNWDRAEVKTDTIPAPWVVR